MTTITEANAITRLYLVSVTAERTGGAHHRVSVR